MKEVAADAGMARMGKASAAIPNASLLGLQIIIVSSAVTVGDYCC
ncbi:MULTISPECIES: hypothetical protein [unclassified Halomonas]|nr:MULTISPECIES: hypothetical protein [unclassified Halomonas]